MQKLNLWLVEWSRRWWIIVSILLMNYLSFRILFGLEDTFERITGIPVFDTQNNLTATTLTQQLPLYEGAARGAYLRFAAFDWVFPFVAALFLAVLWTLLLRITSTARAQQLLAWRLPLWAFVTTGFDYLENISLLAIIAIGSPGTPWIINAAIISKRLKLSGLAFSSAVTLGLTLFALSHWLYRIWRRHQSERAVMASGRD